MIGQGDCPAADSSNPGSVTSVQEADNALVVTLDRASPGWLVLADTYYPGWTAAVDGQAAPVERANLAFRAVQIPAGAKTVRFDYRPGWLLPGALLSLAGLVIALALLRLGEQGSDKERGDDPDRAVT